MLPLEPAKPGHPESGKRPITAHGVDDATKDYENFLELVRGRDDFNIGIATGKASGIIVIDRDPRNGSQSSFAALVEEFGKLPTGPKVKTGGGGFHNYFRCPEGISHAPTKLADDIDVKYDRGYVVAPPSKHASGVEYKWVRGRNSQETSLRKLGVNWVAALKSKTQRKGEHRTTVEVTVTSNDSDAATPREGHVQQGHRNNFLAELAGKLRAMGRSVAEVEAELLRLNEAICNPPLGRDEVVKVAHSSGRWATHQGPGEPSVTEQIVTQLLDREFASGAHLRFERDSQFYAFNRTHWCARDVKDIERHCHDIIKADFGSARQRLVQAGRDAIALLKVQQSRDDIDPLHFVTSPPPVINTLNGEIWLLPDGANEFRAHSAKTGMRHVLQVEFDPHAKCPEFDRALAEIFANARQPKRLAKVWHQLTGYIIQPTRPQAIIVMGVGEGGNGKSKLVQTIMKLLGPDAVYSGDIAQLEASQFGIGGLAGKLLFVDDDVKSRSQLPDGILKRSVKAKN